MAIPIKVRNFLIENKNNPQDEVVKKLAEKFNYKATTALAIYINRNCRNKKELTFKFFKENPLVLNDVAREKYTNQLGIVKATYENYKSEYKLLYLPIKEKKDIQEWDRHYKGRLREKFTFDDSKL